MKKEYFKPFSETIVLLTRRPLLQGSVMRTFGAEGYGASEVDDGWEE